MRDLTKQELHALAGAACFAACELTTKTGMAAGDRKTLRRLRSSAANLITQSGLNPTQLKELGLELAGLSREAEPDAR